MGSCFGTTSVSFAPPAMRRSLTWLPFWLKTLKPNCPKMSTTSLPASILSFDAMRGVGDFKVGEYRRSGAEAELTRIFPLKIQLYRFLDICLELFKCIPLRNDRRIEPLGGVHAVILRNAELNDVFHTSAV